MDKQGYTTPKYYIWKGLVFLGIFSILHFLYDLLPYPVVLIIAASDESVFSHMKLAFWSYLIVVGIEYLIYRNGINNKRGFLLARLTSTVLMPWSEVLTWYIVPYFAKAEIELGFELTWSFSILFISVLLLGGLEREWQKNPYPRYQTIAVLVYFGLALFFFTAWTFEKPWIDIFYLPP